MLHVCGIIDHYAWWQGWHRYLKGAESDEPLTSDEPIEQLVSWLEEPDAIPSQGKGSRRPSVIEN